jgi:hypothetical protein
MYCCTLHALAFEYHAIRKGGVVLPRGVVQVGSEDTDGHGEQRWDDMAEGSGWDALTRRATVHQAQVSNQVPVDFWKSPPAYVVATRGYPHAPAPAPVLLVVGGARPPHRAGGECYIAIGRLRPAAAPRLLNPPFSSLINLITLFSPTQCDVGSQAGYSELDIYAE